MDIFNYFSGSTGCTKIFEAVKTMLYAKQSSSNGNNNGNIRDNDKLFFPENEILLRAKSDAKKLEAHRMNKRKGDISQKVEGFK